MRAVPRLFRIVLVAARHGLFELTDGSDGRRPLRWLRRWLPGPSAAIAHLPRGERLALALTELGPIFVKFGQILSTRRDLLPPDIADELTALQDRVAPFPGVLARAAIERELGRPVTTLFASFGETPLASASIAQVHPATLPDGRSVVVKVLRPDVAPRIARDVALLRALADVAARHHPNADKIRPHEVVDEIETTLVNELDLQREGANASLLRRNFAGSDDLYVPAVHWSHSSAGVLTLERVSGIPVDDLAALDAAGIDRRRLAAKGVELFYTQVFRDNFFHADAHAGNIWVDATRREDPRFIALDFGIMGTLPEADQYWLAENFIALFNQDYRRIAELHLRAGWMPAHVRLDELESAVRTVCEPYFTRPLSEISLAEVTVKLFQTARRYELVLQPQLILLQKTLLNIEGVGRLLDPDIDIWATAKPVLERIWRRRHGPRALLARLRKRIPEWLAAAPDMPSLTHRLLEQATTGSLELRLASADLKRLAGASRGDRRSAVWRMLGAALIVAAALLFTFPDPPARIGDVSWPTWAALFGAIGAFFAALRPTDT
ncbi:MAG TPA: ubiquinone biosynthesis regulatory protein kinase UbiB [Dokdonella sp.]|uniref:ubiquinone biosynthesis regulatory protein kinase UbiB n=1 Tax=Dokdonella sp. TaxID=2291710 RepID=UPI002CABA726|nr:ubiquinone biosynthesis regulatory protein kinase UbiB [Dokdonella sp.]HUD42854.1 ubiquinone biosynthesis regulatory protein kinase UbiB [Dokdonella sp.]